MYIVYVQYSTVYIGKHNGDMGENKKLYTFFVNEGPLSVPGFYFMYNFWQDAGIRTRVAATAARCAANELYTLHKSQLVLEIQKITPVISQIKYRQKSK